MKLDYFKQHQEEGAISDINVTNLIDVTLILLIIFILIAPIMEQGISLTLPKATAEKSKPKKPSPWKWISLDVCFWTPNRFLSTISGATCTPLPKTILSSLC